MTYHRSDEDLSPQILREDRVIDSEKDGSGDCAICGCHDVHSSSCPTLARRRAEVNREVDAKLREKNSFTIKASDIDIREVGANKIHATLASAIADVEAEILSALANLHPDKLTVSGNVSVNTNARQVGGTHYGLKAYQHWDVVDEFKLDYFQGQITKYVMRWRDKNGVEDLEKAQHYLEKYIALEKAKQPSEPDSPARIG